MTKKFTGIRLDDDLITFLSEEALSNGIHHKLSSNVPNITKIIKEIILSHKRLSEKGITLTLLNKDSFLEQVSSIITNHNS